MAATTPLGFYRDAYGIYHKQFANPHHDTNGRFAKGDGGPEAGASAGGGGPSAAKGQAARGENAKQRLHSMIAAHRDGAGAMPDPKTWKKATHGDTASRNKDASGNYTPERSAFHHELVQGVVAHVPRSAQPTFTMMGGGPAAGKSTIINEGQVSIPDSNKAVHINADSFKEKIPEFGMTVKAGNRLASTVVHEESSDLTTMAMSAATNKRADMVLDGTGDSSIVNLKKKIDIVRAKGYKVEGHYVTCPTNDAVYRSLKRGEKPIEKGGGRFVPDSVIRATHASVSRVLPEALKQNLFDRVDLYDTGKGGKPRLVMSHEGGKTTIHDRELWGAFLAKGSERYHGPSLVEG